MLGSGSRTGKRRKPSKGAVSSDGPQGSYSLIPQGNTVVEVALSMGLTQGLGAGLSNSAPPSSLDMAVTQEGNFRGLLAFCASWQKLIQEPPQDVGVVLE